MGVMHALHQHVFTRQESNIRMVTPQRVSVSAPIFLVLKFLKRLLMTMLLKKFDYSSTYEAVYELKHFGGFVFTVRYQVKMIRHNHIRENQEITGGARFSESIGCYGLQNFEPKNWQAIFRH